MRCSSLPFTNRRQSFSVLYNYSFFSRYTLVACTSKSYQPYPTNPSESDGDKGGIDKDDKYKPGPGQCPYNYAHFTKQCDISHIQYLNCVNNLGISRSTWIAENTVFEVIILQYFEVIFLQFRANHENLLSQTCHCENEWIKKDFSVWKQYVGWRSYLTRLRQKGVKEVLFYIFEVDLG